MAIRPYHIFPVLMLVFMVSAEIGEIKTQTVPIYDYIRQYAVIQKIDAGAVYKEYCTDCVCTVSLGDYSGEILSNKSMVVLETGLYGYRAIPTEVIVDKTYNARFYCISPIYGNGTIYGTVSIVGQDTLSVNTAGDDASVSADLWTDPGAFLAELGEKVKEAVSDGLTQALENYVSLYSAGTLDTGLIGAIFSAFASIIGSLINAGVFISDALKHFLMFFGSYEESQTGLSWFTDKFFTLLKPLILFFLAPLILYEALVIVFNADKPLTEWVNAVGRAQKLPFQILYQFFQFIRSIAITLYQLLIEAIGAIPFI